MKIEDYGFLSDTQTGALVGRNGSVDWLCFPRFDSAACFAALLGEPKNGRWLIGPTDESAEVTRRYRGHTLILETTFETKDGAVRLIDFMPPRGTNPDIVRIVEGVRGKVALRMELIIRFDYGDVVPWVRKCGDGLEAIAGPNALVLRTPIETRGEDLTTVAEFEVAKGERVPFVLTWYQSHENPPRAIHPEHALRDTEKYWRDWAGCCEYGGKWNDAVVRSLVTLKGLTYAPTGGIVAAATTSLPEKIGGVRNWDYRYCWLRDATFTLFALTRAGFVEEARSWRGWLLRAIAGSPAQMQILYGMHGERRLPEFEIEWLAGYENSRPVRVGNAAVNQLQLDVYGEILNTAYRWSRSATVGEGTWWSLSRLVDWIAVHWVDPDSGIWEVRATEEHYVMSKVMCWVALDRGVKMAREFDLPCSIERWEAARDAVWAEVMERGWSDKRQSFVQFYGTQALDAANLIIPMVGFLPADHERVKGTIAATLRDLTSDDKELVYRYRNDDGLPGSEGVFSICTFWMAQALILSGDAEQGERIFCRMLKHANHVGLYSEELDPKTGGFAGNFPQGLTHIALINCALALADVGRG